MYVDHSSTGVFLIAKKRMNSPKPKVVLPMTPQEISDYDEDLRQKREKLTLFTRPLDTIRLFCTSICSLTSYCIRSSVSHPAFLYFVIPILMLWGLAKYIPGKTNTTHNS